MVKMETSINVKIIVLFVPGSSVCDQETKNKHKEKVNVVMVIAEVNTGKLRRDKDGQNWGGLKWIAFGLI